MRVLLWDIETSPHVGYHWGLFDQNIGLNQLIETGRVIVVGYKWLGEGKAAKAVSEHVEGREAMLQKVWDLLNEADALVSWNGASFDTKTMAKDFFLAGMPPPSPAKEIDLMRAAKKRFRLASNKLQFVAEALGLEGKVSHEGFGLWRRCLEGDESAWRLMIRYCKKDVELLEPIYNAMRAWVPSLPSPALYDGGDDRCAACGGTDLEKRGFAYTPLGKFQQYWCRTEGCGRWSRSGKRLDAVDLRPVAS